MSNMSIYLIRFIHNIVKKLPRWLNGKEFACQCRRNRRHGFDCWVGQISWRRKWQPTPASLARKSHGQRSLVGYSLGSHKDTDMIEQLSMHAQYCYKQMAKEIQDIRQTK